MTLKEFERALDAAAAAPVAKIKTLVPCRRVTLVPGCLTFQTDPVNRIYDVTVRFGNDNYGGPDFRYEIGIGSFMPFNPTMDTPERTYYHTAAALLDDDVAGKIRMLLKTYWAKAQRLKEEFTATNK